MMNNILSDGGGGVFGALYASLVILQFSLDVFATPRNWHTLQYNLVNLIYEMKWPNNQFVHNIILGFRPLCAKQKYWYCRTDAYCNLQSSCNEKIPLFAIVHSEMCEFFMQSIVKTYNESTAVGLSMDFYAFRIVCRVQYWLALGVLVLNIVANIYEHLRCWFTMMKKLELW